MRNGVYFVRTDRIGTLHQEKIRLFLLGGQVTVFTTCLLNPRLLVNASECMRPSLVLV
jgi:hypothetical protein